MWTLFVVFRLPVTDLPACVKQVGEPAHLQALFAQPSMEALHVRVLCRLTRLDVSQFDPPVQRPGQEIRLVNSGPLSQRIAWGRPRRAMISPSTRVTRRLAKPVSTSSARHSRVNASTTLSTRMLRPASITSWAKSSAHSWLAPVSAGRGDPTRTQNAAQLLVAGCAAQQEAALR